MPADPVDVGRTGQTAVAVNVYKFGAALLIVCAEPRFLIVEADAAVRLALRRDPDIAQRTLNLALRHQQRPRK